MRNNILIRRILSILLVASILTVSSSTSALAAEEQVFEEVVMEEEIFQNDYPEASDDTYIEEEVLEDSEVIVEDINESADIEDIEVKEDTVNTAIEETVEEELEGNVITTEEVLDDAEASSKATEDAQIESDGDALVFGGDMPYVEEVEIDSLLNVGGSSEREEEMISLCDAGELPGKYVPSYESFPALRNQANTNMCWAFSSMFMAEANMIKKGLATVVADYAELALAYFMVHPVVDPLNLTSKDSNTDGPTHNFYTGGGNTIYSAMILANWVGAAKDEGVIAFSNRENVWAANYLDDEYAYSHDVAVLVGSRELDITTRQSVGGSEYETDEYIIANRNAAKQLIMENGSISSSMYAVDSSTYYNAANNAYYYPANSPSGNTNHSVTIIGWDDDFAKEKFNSVSGYGQPIADGAWLVRNSYYNGKTEDFRGYFWLSYYDAMITNTRSFVFDDASKYDNNYHYDGGVVSTGITNYEVITAANVYTAASSAGAEYIKTASFDTPTTNLTYTIDVYRNPKDGDPSSGEKVEGASVTGTTSCAGYYTVPLGCDVLVKKGEKFAIVVKLSKPEATVKIHREKSTSATSWLVSTVAANKGESYYKTGTVWVDAGEQYNGNIRIKAFTVDAQKMYTVHYDANGGNGVVSDDFNNVGASFTLKDNEFTLDNYQFVEWNTKADGTGESYQPGESVDMHLDAGDEVTFYAIWRLVGWVKDSNGYRYYNVDGTYPKNCWQEIDGKKYRFDTNGYRITGWKRINEKYYYMNKAGVMKTGWLKIKDKWYFFASDGPRLTGWNTIDGKKYYFNKVGVMQTGWLKRGGKYYYLNKSGVMKTGWVQLKGKKYYFNKAGVMKTGWLKLKGKWYYFNKSGVMKTGWVKLKGKWYYLNKKGIMRTGWIKVSGSYYYLYKNGQMAVNTWIGNYYVNEKGVWTKTR